MVVGTAHLASASAMLVHTSLVPAGCGAVAALVAVSRPTARTSAGQATGSPRSRRVVELRALASQDQLAVLPSPLPLAAAPVPPTTTAAERRSDRSTSLWQLATVCTAASGIVHAVAGPHHAAESLAFGLFFFLSAVVQFGWATVALTSPSRSLLWHGVWLNVLLVELWVVTRTTGLPFGLQQGPEGVGAWDVAAKLWELGALACCATLLLVERRDRPTASGEAVPAGVRWWVSAALAGSLAALLVLALSGSPS